MDNAKLKLHNGVLSVEGMAFYAYHGCLPEENKIGTNYFVDVEIEGDFSKSINQDELQNTFDYSTIYSIVKKEMEEPSKLIEHVAGRIANALKLKLTDMKKLIVSVTKTNPPVNGNMAQSKIKLVFDLEKNS